ncbi:MULTISPECIES: TetR/AcrR family transcriptional regulator [unclassified Leisingera]|uniref:TetR/AcrR family transcriptional regulator n=2 Tax=Leisingera TaxID=191028 RepID=UPI001013751F|nr:MULTISPECIES: TetR/AcrR family transcriptional regulator [unclassified Leisingera]QAX30905.1 TetR/AcrR family transcriptional regulator [Leisingera sp. NJS204]QBR35128.1 TetR/AcrR family transcriptional regulator [Leisingera sp. NJS201]
MPPRMGRPPRGSRTLSKDDVLKTALQLLDEGGSKALTFKALAKALGVTPMAVAHHAGTKDEMIASLVAIAFAGSDTPSEAATPKLRLRDLMTRYCAQVTKHPELAKCILENPALIGPSLTGLTRLIEAEITAADVSGAEARTILCLLVDYTHGFAFAAAAAPRGALSAGDFTPALDWVLDRIE